jgi:4'-phosphopantetheinyl transferase
MDTVATMRLWHVELDATPEPFVSSLSLEELDRARRFQFPAHRNRFVVCRGMLRTILAGRLGIAPAQVRFEYGPHGKPALEGAAGPHFNISHSDAWAVIVVCDDHPVGIDLERVREMQRLPQVAMMVFNDRERGQMQSLTGEARTLAFFRGWTRKEAYFKATGAGLSASLHSVTVDLAGPTPRILAIDDDDAARWSMQEVPAPPGIVAALAVPCTRTDLVIHLLPRGAARGSAFDPST